MKRGRSRAVCAAVLLSALGFSWQDAQAYTNVPVQGTWWLQTFVIDPSPRWIRGLVDVDARGYYGDLLMTDIGIPGALTGQVSLVSAGIGSFDFRDPAWDERYEFMTIGRPRMDFFVGTGASAIPLGPYIPPAVEVQKSFVAGVRLDPEGYKPADLEGLWTIMGMDHSSVTSHWVRGWLSVSKGGACTGEVADSAGGIAPLVGTISIATNGEVTTTINASWRGAMPAGRDLIFATQTRAPGFLEMDVMVKMQGPYSVTQLVGRSGVAYLKASADPSRAEGLVRIGAGGAYRMCQRVDGGSIEYDSGTLLYGPLGMVTVAGDSNWLAVAVPSRDFLVGNNRDEDVDYFMAVHVPPPSIDLARVIDFGVADKAVGMGWIGAGGEPYEIWGTGTLSLPGSWTADVTGILGVAPSHSYRNFGIQQGLTIVPPQPHREYRIEVPLP